MASGKLLGLDLGEKKVGIAVSDIEQKIAFPRKVIRYEGFKKFLVELKDFCEQEKIVKIIIGLPLSMGGTDSDQTLRARKQAEKIKAHINLEIEFIDERLTSIIAEHEAQLSKKKIREIDKDDISAQKILQIYLDKQL
jgi:putative holliday junction resolvase